jgi:hypothetical protein
MNVCPICDKDCHSSYCSLSCSNKDRPRKNEIQYLLNPKTCKRCAGPIPYKVRRQNVFCSSSCSALHNNPLKPKKQYRCQDCGFIKKTRSYRLRCMNCAGIASIEEFGNKQLKDFNSTYARHRYQKIRGHAHRVVKRSNMEKVCGTCGYSKYVELAHRKPIHSFSSESRLKEINALSNLIYLCPNHHWELDNGVSIGLYA